MGSKDRAHGGEGWFNPAGITNSLSGYDTKLDFWTPPLFSRTANIGVSCAHFLPLPGHDQRASLWACEAASATLLQQVIRQRLNPNHCHLVKFWPKVVRECSW